MFQFRDAEAADFELIASFPQNREEAFYMFPKGDYPLMAEQLQDKAALRYSLTVVTKSGQVVAYGNLYDVEPGEACYIGNVIVSPGARRSGAGAYLIRTLVRRAAEEHRVRQVHLICHNPNTPALLFYDRLGFRPSGMKRMESYNQDTIAGIRMTLEV